MKKLVPLGLLLGFGLALWQYGEYQKAEGARQARLTQLVRVEQRLDTVYHQDTVILTRWRTRFRDSVVTRFDTLHDTTTVMVEVVKREIIAPAESTIAACVLALNTCESRVENMRVQRDEWRAKASPSFLEQAVTILKIGSVFYALGKISP